jgi:hypothetical protein
MTTKTLSAPLVTQTFPAGTVDPGFTFTVTGTLADGVTPFTGTVTNPSSSVSFDLPPGTFTGVVSKLGVSSAPTEPLTLAAPVLVTLSVPDTTQKATFA